MPHFDRALLPPPRAFYEREFGLLARVNRRGWSQARCPWHKSRGGRSLSVNLVHGGFYCFGCDHKGGDIIAFVRQKYGLSFTAALAHLGVERGTIPNKARPRVRERWLVMDFVVDGIMHQAAVRDEPETMLQLYRRIHAGAADGLSELHRGDPEREEGETELQWEILALSWELIRLEEANGEQA